jgi:hypothetical protein
MSEVVGYPAVLKMLNTKHKVAKVREPESEVVGELEGYPMLDSPLVFYSEGLEDTDKVRQITTSDVTKIDWQEDGFEVETKFSTYKITMQPEVIEQLKSSLN